MRCANIVFSSKVIQGRVTRHFPKFSRLYGPYYSMSYLIYSAQYHVCTTIVVSNNHLQYWCLTRSRHLPVFLTHPLDSLTCMSMPCKVRAPFQNAQIRKLNWPLLWPPQSSFTSRLLWRMNVTLCTTGPTVIYVLFLDADQAPLFNLYESMHVAM